MKCDLESHAFVSFEANLTHFEAKPDIPGLHHLLSSLLLTTYKGISDLESGSRNKGVDQTFELIVDLIDTIAPLPTAPTH